MGPRCLEGVEASALGVITHEPYVIYFGHVAARTQSEPIEVTVLDLPKRGAARSKLGGFQSSSPNFRVERQAVAPGAAGCEPTQLSIRLIAPNEPGLVRGLLSWTFETDDAAAISVTEMVGVVD